MGQFAGSSDALDVFMYSPDGAADLLLRNRRDDGFDGFEAIDAPAPDRAIPVVGNFGEGGTRDQILWYRPGPASERMWSFDENGDHEVVSADVDQSDWRIPLTGHFRSRLFSTDIIWFEPRTATVDTWLFNSDFSSLKSGSHPVEPLGVVEGTEYLPIVGNIKFDSYEFAVDGEYHPTVGDFDGDGDDDILWYRPAGEMAGGPSWLWYFDGQSVEARAVAVNGDYVPYVEGFDGDGCTDILWYDPVAPDSDSAVWRCMPQDKTFSCDEHVAAPKLAYPIGFGTGGY